jgi:hypothetical protein
MVILIDNILPNVSECPCYEYWRLHDDINVKIDDIDILIPAGFLTDWASIPDFVKTLLFSNKCKYNIAAIVHDYLYKNKMFDRSKCDEIFYQINRNIVKVNWFQSYSMWCGVRAAGWKYYGTDGTKEHNECVHVNECKKTNKE